MLKTIERETFCQCKNLKIVDFSEGLEKIDIQAFALSGLENVELPTSLRTVAQTAFAKCENLKTVKINEGLEVLGTNEYPEEGKIWYGVF